MKRRVVKKVERRMLADVLCEKQQRIDEYERYIGDLLVMLCAGREQLVLEHGYPDQLVDEMRFIWNKVRDLIVENKTMAQSLKEKDA